MSADVASMGRPGEHRLEERVLILAPSGRDGQLAAAALCREGLAAVCCLDAEQLAGEIQAGAAVGLVTEEALVRRSRDDIVQAIERQPLWSDFPFVVLAARPPSPSGRQLLSRLLSELGNVTVLDRPLHPEAMLSAVRAALRARGRQYQARELLSRLEEGVRERDQFLATLGHELRNPLGAISNAMQLLARQCGPEEVVRRPLAVVERQTRHLARLVDDLLDVSRVTTGKVVLQLQVIDLRHILQNVIQQLEPAMEEHGLQLLSSLGWRALPVRGDVVRLEQVFTNLLTNAMKYTPRGGQVTVTTEVDDQVIRVRVADTGVGIAPEMLPSIFRMFAQADQSLDRAQGGMGIGLTLVRSLLELHGGEVQASSAGRGRGAQFVVQLPTAAAEMAMNADPPAGRERPRVARQILLVEDNPDNRESLRELLELDGHQVAIAADGPEAVARALALRPQVAIIDIGLPGIDGFEVARRVRAALGAGIYLIALTGYGQPEDRRRSAESGFDAHVTKPAGLSELEAVLAGIPPTRFELHESN